MWWLVGLLACTGGPSAASEALPPTPAPAAAPAPAPVPAPTRLAASDPWTLQQAAADHGLPWPPPDVRLAVDKSERTLVVRSGETLLKRYRVGLGGAPEGDKERQGDNRTPTGDFTVVTRNERSHYHLFLGLSYPDTEDADRGVRDGLITEGQAALVRDADAAGRRPPWDTALGGAIGIHGNGGEVDWTLGCIAVDDAEIEELWAVVSHGTPVAITE